MDTSKLAEYLLIWAVVLGLVGPGALAAEDTGGGPDAGLPAKPVADPLGGAAVYVLPAFQNQDSRLTELGFEQTLYGVLAFAFGGLILTLVFSGRHSKSLWSAFL